MVAFVSSVGDSATEVQLPAITVAAAGRAKALTARPRTAIAFKYRMTKLPNVDRLVLRRRVTPSGSYKQDACHTEKHHQINRMNKVERLRPTPM
jgi:hypothetical protein